MHSRQALCQRNSCSAQYNVLLFFFLKKKLGPEIKESRVKNNSATQFCFPPFYLPTFTLQPSPQFYIRNDCPSQFFMTLSLISRVYAFVLSIELAYLDLHYSKTVLVPTWISVTTLPLYTVTLHTRGPKTAHCKCCHPTPILGIQNPFPVVRFLPSIFLIHS